MRLFVTVRIPTEAGNRFIKDPTFGEKLQTILGEQKAESVYFTASDGLRTIYYVTNQNDASKLPAIAEPWWLLTGAEVNATPAMLPEDMAKASADVAAAVKRWAQK